MKAEHNGLATADELREAGSKITRRYKEPDPCPVNGKAVRLQSLTENEVSQYQMAVMSSRGAGVVKGRLEDASRRLFVRCLVDGESNRLLGDHETDVFRNWDAADTNYLYDECAGHCGINRESIEELVKNSPATSVASSPSDSPTP